MYYRKYRKLFDLSSNLLSGAKLRCQMFFNIICDIGPQTQSQRERLGGGRRSALRSVERLPMHRF